MALICLYCGSSRVVRRGWQNRIYQRYCCKDCGRWFNDRTGTAMAYSRLPLRFWFFTAFMMQSKVSVKEVAETLQRPYAIIFRMVRKLRENLYLTASTVSLKGIVEVQGKIPSKGVENRRVQGRMMQGTDLKSAVVTSYLKEPLKPLRQQI